MKKYLLWLICMLLFPAFAAASVPDAVLHEAVLSLAWPDNGGECWVEGHVVLGEKNKGSITEVYAEVFYQNYGFMDGVFTGSGGGSTHPATLIFENTEDGHILKEILVPEDGEKYAESIQQMMPKPYFRRRSDESESIRAEMVRQMHEQAQNYLNSIGRTEPIQDWRERNLQLSGMLVAASNLMSDVDQNYPLWVTSHERLENGCRYIYTRDWRPEKTLPDGQTGTLLLTKTRYHDQAVVETITAKAEEERLTITLADAGGSITYTFAYDGRNYQRPVITKEGECGMDQSGILMDISRLPE